MDARETIKLIMKEKGVTNAELARRLSITQATLWDRLNNRKGRKDIPVSLLSEMLAALECKVVIVDNDKQYEVDCQTVEQVL